MQADLAEGRAVFGTESDNLRGGDDRHRRHRRAGVPDRTFGARAASDTGAASGAGPADAVAAMVRIHAGAHLARRDRGVRHLARFQRQPMGVGRDIGDWRSDTRTIIFAAVMVGARRDRACRFARLCAGPIISGARSRAGRSAATAESGAGRRGAGACAFAAACPRLAALVVAIVLLCWIGLPSAEQYGLVAQLIYPASLGVTLVLLFDKATRTWGIKGAAETVREWLFCDLLVFLLVSPSSPARPRQARNLRRSFWDILNVVLFFAAFWLVDRTAGARPFLLGYGYLVVAAVVALDLGYRCRALPGRPHGGPRCGPFSS